MTLQIPHSVTIRRSENTPFRVEPGVRSRQKQGTALRAGDDIE
jgi:hypothetical protein